MSDAPWTIDELADQVDAALAGGSYQGTPDGRVRDRPNARAIRWYATIGLLDRPAEIRGRTAYYGLRHLLQLVAVKRRQAAGHSIAEIQAELAGAPDRVLAGIAELPAALPRTGPAADASPRRTRSGRAASQDRATPSASVTTGGSAAGSSRSAGAFWTSRPTKAAAPEPPTRSAGPAATPLFGVPLRDGAVLVLTAQPDHDDTAAIAAAARPLLDLLAARGLLPPTGRETR
ncbi:MerR family transcriptional regulator [Plantactinospora sp. GCM10030261]|uniref:helix-turn-helix domain-containing protein n=1 Tax=Plantactinospora sp. GCM10030261 TaxID=3273420 RepID=UPI00361A7924